MAGMDDVIGMTSATVEEGGFMLSIDLHINYLGKIEAGEPVLARARIVRSGKRIAKEQGYRTKKTRQPIRETGCLAWFDEGEFSVSALCSGNY